MGRNCVPEDDPLLCAQLLEQAVDYCAGGFAPTIQPTAAGPVVWRAPASQIALAGEGDTGPAHPLVAGRLAYCKDVRFLTSQQVVTQVRQPDGGCPGDIVGTCLGEGIEGGADSRRRQLFQQAVDRGSLVRMRQW